MVKLVKKPRFSHHQHTGRKLHRHHTSYALLTFLLMMVGMVLLVVTTAALGAAENPQSGSIGLSGTVPGPAPKLAATIDVPTEGQRFTVIPIDVRGKCTPDLIVEIFKNDIFAGSTVCQSNGTYSLKIDLFNGRNILVARIVDALGQFGPDSAPVTVIFDESASLGQVATGSDIQLFLRTDAPITRGIHPSSSLEWPVEVIGGAKPYAISWDWGDDSVADLISRNEPGRFDGKHTYVNPGTYQVIVRATDSAGRRAYLSLVAVVDGQLQAVATKPIFGGRLAFAWPLLILALLMVLSFWLGEKFEKKHLANQGAISA